MEGSSVNLAINSQKIIKKATASKSESLYVQTPMPSTPAIPLSRAVSHDSIKYGPSTDYKYLDILTSLFSSVISNTADIVVDLCERSTEEPKELPCNYLNSSVVDYLKENWYTFLTEEENACDGCVEPCPEPAKSVESVPIIIIDEPEEPISYYEEPSEESFRKPRRAKKKKHKEPEPEEEEKKCCCTIA